VIWSDDFADASGVESFAYLGGGSEFALYTESLGS